MGIKWHESRFSNRPGTVNVKCQSCERDMWFPASKATLYRTCGGECSAKVRRENRLDRLRNCMTCGIEFFPRKFQIASGEGKYCSHKCNRAAHEAMNSKEAKAKAVVTWKKTIEQKGGLPRGELSPKWKGGRSATYLRLKENGRIRDANHKRRLRTKNGLPADTIPNLKKLQRMKCASCWCGLDDSWHLDHIVPLAKGGKHEPLNVQLLCRTCNLKKSSKLPHEWAAINGKLL